MEWKKPTHHKYPLSVVCGSELIWEKCSFEPPYSQRATLNLREISHQLIKSLHVNIDLLEENIQSVEDWRTVDLRTEILERVHTYFDNIQELVEKARDEKVDEVHKVFSALKFDQLDDLQVYHDLVTHSKKALKSIRSDYKKMAFNMIYLSKPSYDSISERLEAVAHQLKSTKQLYDEKCNEIFFIDEDVKWFKNIIDTQCKALGSIGKPQSSVDEHIRKIVNSIQFDVSVIDTLKENSLFMGQSEKEVIYNALNAIKQGTKAIMLNYGQVTQYGCQILSEALITCETVSKYDLSNNDITAKGCSALSKMIESNIYLKHIRLSSCNLTDEAIEQLWVGLALNRTVKTLYLNDNQITDEGAIKIAEMLDLKDHNNQSSSEISCLYLDKNYIAETGAIALANVLKSTTKLNMLYLNSNCISNKGVIALSHAIEDNQSIHNCYLFDNQMTKEIQILVKKRLGDRVMMTSTLI